MPSERILFYKRWECQNEIHTKRGKKEDKQKSTIAASETKRFSF